MCGEPTTSQIIEQNLEDATTTAENEIKSAISNPGQALESLGQAGFQALQSIPGEGAIASEAASGLSAVGQAIEDGALIERSFTTGGTTIGVLGEASVSGTSLTLNNIAVYPDGTTSASVGSGAVLSMFNSFASEAEAAGFTSLTVSGFRYGGANPGRVVTITRSLGGP